MYLRRTFAIVLRQFYLIRGSLTRTLPLFAWVALDILLWGFITKYLNTITAHGMDVIPTLLGAVLLWDFFTRVMYGVTMAFFEDAWSRNFLNIFATPLSILEYVSGLILSSTLTSSIGLITMLVLASAIFGLSFFLYGLATLPFLIILFLFGIALGVCACSLVLRFGPAAEWLIWPMPVVIAPFVGVFYPLSTLPQWMQHTAIFLPPSYVFEGIRTIVSDGVLSGKMLLWSSGLDVLYILLAYWVFARTYKHAVRIGLIARYSAESLT